MTLPYPWIGLSSLCLSLSSCLSHQCTRICCILGATFKPEGHPSQALGRVGGGAWSQPKFGVSELVTTIWLYLGAFEGGSCWNKIVRLRWGASWSSSSPSSQHLQSQCTCPWCKILLTRAAELAAIRSLAHASHQAGRLLAALHQAHQHLIILGAQPS